MGSSSVAPSPETVLTQCITPSFSNRIRVCAAHIPNEIYSCTTAGRRASATHLPLLVGTGLQCIEFLANLEGV